MLNTKIFIECQPRRSLTKGSCDKKKEYSDLQYSGYSDKSRYAVVDSALKAYRARKKTIKREKDRYIDPKSGGEKNEFKKR